MLYFEKYTVKIYTHGAAPAHKNFPLLAPICMVFHGTQSRQDPFSKKNSQVANLREVHLPLLKCEGYTLQIYSASNVDSKEYTFVVSARSSLSKSIFLKRL